MKEKFDDISRPSHYVFSTYEPKDVIYEWGLNFNLGNVVKYVARAGRKGNKTEDLKKARQYLDFEIEELEKENSFDLMQQAARFLQNELLKHGTLYEGFLSSIESSVKEQELHGLPFQPDREIAEKILKRIIGEE